MANKLNKETLEASLVQIEYLKGIKKDQMNGLCKMFDGNHFTKLLYDPFFDNDFYQF